MCHLSFANRSERMVRASASTTALCEARQRSAWAAAPAVCARRNNYASECAMRAFVRWLKGRLAVSAQAAALRASQMLPRALRSSATPPMIFWLFVLPSGLCRRALRERQDCWRSVHSLAYVLPSLQRARLPAAAHRLALLVQLAHLGRLALHRLARVCAHAHPLSCTRRKKEAGSYECRICNMKDDAFSTTTFNVFWRHYNALRRKCFFLYLEGMCSRLGRARGSLEKKYAGNRIRGSRDDCLRAGYSISDREKFELGWGGAPEPLSQEVDRQRFASTSGGRPPQPPEKNTLMGLMTSVVDAPESLTMNLNAFCTRLERGRPEEHFCPVSSGDAARRGAKAAPNGFLIQGTAPAKRRGTKGKWKGGQRGRVEV
ncbi:Protein of unknown function [Gryllus bimaculatus]|nr:Protein of unknown function [Gryllus bimaculatus]